MTDDEQVINEAEAILQQAKDAMRQAQSAEHIATMPYLMKEAKRIIANTGKSHRAVHMLLILEDPDGDMSKAANPLGIEGNDRSVAIFKHVHSWNTEMDAIKMIMTPESLVINREASKQRRFATFIASRTNLYAYYVGGKLTIGRLDAGDEATTHHVDIGDTPLEPDDFFAQCDLVPIERELINALMAFMEGGRMMEQETPALYGVLAKRALERKQQDNDGE